VASFSLSPQGLFLCSKSSYFDLSHSVMIKNELSNVLFIAKEAIVLQRSEFLQLPALHNIPPHYQIGRQKFDCVQSPELAGAESRDGILERLFFSRGFKA